ncbi:MAG: CarD family transcriptional regulator [Bacillota bacterium]|nr:CarD family transcriptional regulator [Bacillota bacterium]
MFEIGEKVLYPVHGAGIIEAIEQREILGEERSYYVLRLSTGDLQVLVPVDTVEKVGLRPICPKSKLAEVENILRRPSPPWEENWNKRYRINMDKIKSGDICQLAEVICSLNLRDLEKGLSAGEKKMLENAKRILISEMIFCAEIDQEQASTYLQNCLSAECP